MDVDMAAVWPLQVPEGPGTHDQPWPPGAQYAVADGHPAPSVSCDWATQPWANPKLRKRHRLTGRAAAERASARASRVGT